MRRASRLGPRGAPWPWRSTRCLATRVLPVATRRAVARAVFKGGGATAPGSERGGGALGRGRAAADAAARMRMYGMLREMGLWQLAAACATAPGGGDVAPGRGFVRAAALGPLAREGAGSI